MGNRQIIRKRNRYSSYKGTIGKIADNKVKRQFSASQPKTNATLMLRV